MIVSVKIRPFGQWALQNPCQEEYEAEEGRKMSGMTIEIDTETLRVDHPAFYGCFLRGRSWLTTPESDKRIEAVRKYRRLPGYENARTLVSEHMLEPGDLWPTWV